MKIRIGFVSNSSSSSFIIAVHRDVDTLEKFKEYLFGDTAYVLAHPYNEGEQYSADEVAESLWAQIQLQSPKTKDEILKEYMSGWTDEYEFAGKLARREMGISCRQEAPCFGTPEYKKFREREAHYQRLMSEDTIDQTFEWDLLDGNHFFVVEYADDDCHFSAAMEHGNVWDHITHLKVSKH